MALTMADYIERKGLGVAVDPNEVNLTPNELARLSRIQGMDPASSGYAGQSIMAAQQLASDLPTAADLGLMVEQNRQLQAAGGRGYVGNVHNLQGGQTPFEALTQSVAESARPDLYGGIEGVPQRMSGDGNGPGGGQGADFDGETLGPYGTESLNAAMGSLATKGALGLGSALAVGAPLGLAGKFGLASMLTPQSMLAAIGGMAYSGLKDKALDDTLGTYAGTSISDLDQEALAAHREKMAAAYEAEVPSASIAQMRAAAPTDIDIAQQTMDDIGFFGQARRAGQAALGIARGIGSDIARSYRYNTLRDNLSDAQMAEIDRQMGADPTVGWDQSIKSNVGRTHLGPVSAALGGGNGPSGGGGFGPGGYGASGSAGVGSESRGGEAGRDARAGRGEGGNGGGATGGMGPGSDSGADRSSDDSGGGMGGK